MTNFLAALALSFLLCSGCYAAPIIGGAVNVTPVSSSYNLVGPWFDLTFSGGNPALGGYAPFLRCASGCLEGDVVELTGHDGGDEIPFGSGTVKGVFYPSLKLGGDDMIASSTQIHLLGGSIMVNGSLVYTRQFTLSGALVAFTPPAVCVICAPGTEDLDPLLTNKSIPINGRGTVTLTFDPAVLSDFGDLFFINNVTYQFAAIPEPGTGSYVAASVLLLCLARQVKRLARCPLVSKMVL